MDLGRGEGRPVTLARAVAFVKDEFGRKLTTVTLLNYMKRLRFSSQQVRTSAKGYKLSVDAPRDVALDWLRRSRIHTQRPLLCSIDFTFTSHLANSARTYSPMGGHQPVAAGEVTYFEPSLINIY